MTSLAKLVLADTGGVGRQVTLSNLNAVVDFPSRVCLVLWYGTHRFSDLLADTGRVGRSSLRFFHNYTFTEALPPLSSLQSTSSRKDTEATATAGMFSRQTALRNHKVKT